MVDICIEAKGVGIVFLRVAIGVLLVVHGVIHAVLGVIPNPETDKAVVGTFFSDWAGSWLLGGLADGPVRAIAIVLSALGAVGFVASGLAMLDYVVPHEWWRVLAIASSVGSLLLGVLFWNRNLIVGPVVAVGIIVALALVHWPTEAALGY
jgi:hypothetical protein